MCFLEEQRSPQSQEKGRITVETRTLCLGSQRAKPEGLMKGKHGLQKEEQKVHIGHTNQNTFGVYSASFLTYFAPHPSRIF